MSLNGAIIKAGATSMSVTGGSDITLTETSVPIQRGKQIAVAADTDYRLRRTVTLQVKQPTYSGGIAYSKDRKSVVIQAPKLVQGNLLVANNLIRIEREVHPETTAAEAAELLLLAAQILTDADFSAFFSGGSMA